MTPRRAALLLALAPGIARAQAPSAEAMREIAPTGTLRVGIGVAPVASAFWARRDPATGQAAGVTVDLGRDYARRLGLPVAFQEYRSSGEVTEAGAAGQWDVGFMPVDEERARRIRFGAPYYLFVSTYLVPAGSPIRRFEEVDRPGVRVAGVANTTTIRSAERAQRHATTMAATSVDEILAMLREGRADAVALGRESLDTLAAQLPGSRVLDGHFHATSVAVAVPPGRPAALAAASAFIERARADGTVRRILDAHGMRGPIP
ncbi:MAG TPA: transporter substrate-binding domain-containing protein [Acetobacteraceae bacterium]|nr:transporter substrate-binding domain-containing protein [Acetobacteraceae bacterium]